MRNRRSRDRPWPPMAEVRALRESELEEMIELQCHIFRPRGHERFRGYVHGDPSYELGQTRVVIEGGRIIATLRIWDRVVRIGTTPVRMAGIGGVGTHPDHRGRGHATAMLRDAVSWMRAEGFLASLLFSILRSAFYRELGWASVPTPGFRVALSKPFDTDYSGDFQITSFDESRDLDEVIDLHRDYNSGRSGSLVRDRPYWGSAPSRVRGVLPTAVARDHRGTLAGYLNCDSEGEVLRVNEVACAQGCDAVIEDFAHHVVTTSRELGSREIRGELPHRHALVGAVSDRCGGDLELTGDSTAMWNALDLPALLALLQPEWQGRVDGLSPGPASAGFCVNGQLCGVSLGADGRLQVDAEPTADALPLSGELFWRLLLGESSWTDIEGVLTARGFIASSHQARMLRALFPRREVIFWAPDHY